MIVTLNNRNNTFILKGKSKSNFLSWSYWPWILLLIWIRVVMLQKFYLAILESVATLDMKFTLWKEQRTNYREDT